jgi:multidrug efflux system membrane fusion protein
MRAIFSYGVASAILVAAGAWFATGTLVAGGNGPDKGERPLISVLEGQEDGPLYKTLGAAGILAEHPHPAVDPHLTIAERNAIMVADTNAAAVKVRTQVFQAEPMQIDVPLRGRTKAKATITSAAETTGTVSKVHVSKGQRVDAGAPLCTLDQGTRAAAVAQARAAVDQATAGLAKAQLDFDTNSQLRNKGLAATNSEQALSAALSGAKAGVSAAKAGLDNAIAELDRTEIVAKVAGIVQEPVASEGTLLAMGQPCATIVQLDPMLFIGQVPESRIALARTGLDVKVKTVTGSTVDGKVTFISSVADNATRSFQTEIEFPNKDFAIRDGLTAEATVTLGSSIGHLLPQSVLTLDDNGDLGVRAVEDGKVAFYAVTIVSDTRDGVWVSGLPAKVEVITVGQESVTPGQAVEASAADSEKPASESV